MSSLGVLSNECYTLLEMMNDIGIDKTQQHYIIKKTMISLAIRATYFIFCRRNKTWDSPDLIKLYFFNSFVNTVYKYITQFQVASC